ncbi:MAG: hypothetical protein IJ717_02605 [Treponema sp.]|nr:hypothetical protein [Treponema sp.]
MNIKKSIFAALAALFMAGTVAAQTVAVLEFETEDAQYADRMPILTETFRSEMANSPSLTVVDRNNINAALSEIARSQTSDYTVKDNVKQIGKMLNADYIVIGHVKEIADDPETVTKEYTTVTQNGGLSSLFLGKTKTTTQTRDVVQQNKLIQIVVQMIDVETSGMVASSHKEIKRWSDYNSVVASLAKPLLGEFSGVGKIKRVNTGMFSGTWECELYNNGITDIYTLEFIDDTTVMVSVESIDRKGKSTKSSGRGRWRYNASEKVFVLTVNRLSGNIAHLTRLSWKSMIDPAKNEKSFKMSIPVSSSESARQMRGEFYRTE